MKLSYVIVTHNRCESLLRTIAILYWTTPLPADDWDVWVVDNASTDDSVESLRKRFPQVNVIHRRTNEGTPARNHGIEQSHGRYLILLDDDSYPVDDAAPHSIAYLDQHPQTAAVVGRVETIGGRLEACALPSVLLSGAVCIRRSVLEEVGGFRREFFRKAGEYDLSFRIWQAGHRIERFEDIVYRHEKVTAGRNAALAYRMDMRNNLILADRFLPDSIRRDYRADWSRRYALLARHAGHRLATVRARAEAWLWSLREEAIGRTPLDEATTELIFEFERQALLVSEWSRRHQIKQVAIAQYAKNIFATWRACQASGLDITAVADDHPAMAGHRYRGLPIRPIQDVAADVDGVVLANTNPAQIDVHIEHVREHFAGPILRLWHPRLIDQADQAALIVA